MYTDFIRCQLNGVRFPFMRLHQLYPPPPSSPVWNKMIISPHDAQTKILYLVNTEIRTSCLKQKMRDLRLVSRIALAISAVISVKVDMKPMPWLLKAILRPPKVDTAMSTMFLQSASYHSSFVSRGCSPKAVGDFQQVDENLVVRRRGGREKVQC